MTINDGILIAAIINMLIVQFLPGLIEKYQRKKAATRPSRLHRRSKLRTNWSLILPAIATFVAVRSLRQSLSLELLMTPFLMFRIAWDVSVLTYILVFATVFLPLARRMDRIDKE